MDYKEASAKTVEEAITKACIDLGITSDQLDYEVISEGSSGFLGLGSKDAVIRYRKEETIKMPAAEPLREDKVVSAEDIEARAAAAALRDKELGELHSDRVGSYDRSERFERGDRRSYRRERGGYERKTGARGRDRRPYRRDSRDYNGTRILDHERPHTPSVPKPERQISPKSEEEVASIKGKADTFLRDVFNAMGLAVTMTMEYSQEEGALSCVFAGEEMGILIGKRGQTLDSLQYLTSLVVNRGEEEYIRVKLDTEYYRSRRKETLENLARNIAYKVRHTRKAIALEPMNPYERRIIHSSLQGEEGIETYSDGDDPSRHVVVTLKRE